eukprot:413716-Prymnesium_polylepis.1
MVRSALRWAVLACVLQRATPLAPALRAAGPRCRCATARMVTLPEGFGLPYEDPPLPKVYSDYEWDPDYPGTFKPGKREEMYSLQNVFDMWEGKENPACIELRQDELWEVPLAPPEDILSWLERIGLLVDDDDGDETQEKELTAESSLLDD